MIKFDDERQLLQKERSKSVLEQVKKRDMASVDPEDSEHYHTDRGLRKYNLLLPKHNGLTFAEVLSSRVETTPAGISILDVGCGQGIALAEISLYPGVKASGITATDLREFAPDKLRAYMRQIDFIEGDIADLTRIFRSKRFDLIISVKTFEHLVKPRIAAQQCRELLKPNGLAFIEGPSFDIVLPPAFHR